MDMNINATLIVQAFNFFIAYLILRHFLCKPVVKVIDQEQLETEHLLSVADERTQVLTQTMQTKDAAWKDFQVLFTQTIPPVSRAGAERSDVEPVAAVELPRQQELTQLAQELKHAITQKVSHVE